MNAFVPTDHRTRRYTRYLFSLALMGHFLLIPFNIHAQAGKVTFTGTWTLNESKSNMGEGGFRGASSTLTVKQEGNNLTTERVFTNRDGQEMKSTEKFTLDGKKCENAMGNRTRTSTVTWAADGNSLTFNSVMVFDREGQTMEMKSTDAWKLTDGGKTLTIDSSSDTPMGTRKVTLVYDKK